MTPARRVATSVVVIAGLAGPIRSAEIPACSEGGRVEAWENARRSSSGISGSSRHENLMPDALPSDTCLDLVDFSLRQDGQANDGFHSWVFASGCKRTLCGTAESFESNVATAWLSGEHDLNTNIVPNKEFEDLLKGRLCFEQQTDDGRRFAQEAPHLCFPQTHHVHAEITPPRGLRDLLRSLWLKEDNWTSWRRRLTGGEMCVYGPFVADTGHAAKPEIHPTELFWWNENDDPHSDLRGPDGPFALFLAQDASARYSKTHHFILNEPLPEGGTWRPWARGPIHGRFEIPFWVDAGKTVEFTLRRYPANRWRQTSAPRREIHGDFEDSDETLRLATVHDETRLPPSYKMRIETQVLCKCRGEDCRGGEADPVSGYLAKLVLDAEVGRDIEWEEGHLALLLCDDRKGCGTSAIGSAAAPSKEAPGDVQALVTWKPAGETWRPVPEEPSEEGERRRVIDAMFDAASWPQGLSHPYPVLRRLERVEIEAQAAVPGLTEDEEGRSRVVARFEGARACELVGASCTDATLKPVSRKKAVLDIPPGGVRRIEVDVEVTVQNPAFARAGTERERREPAHAAALPWTLWSHGFKAEGEDFWNEAVLAACRERSKQAVDAAQREAWPEDGHSPGRRVPLRAARVPIRNIRHMIRSIVADKVVSMTELRTLVERLGPLCGIEARSQTPVQYQTAR